MKTITTYIMISLLGCHAPTTKHNGRPDSTQHPSIVETKTDSTIIEYPPYKPFKEFRKDTLSYLYDNFVTRIRYYQSKPLALLLNDIELPIISYTPVFYNNHPSMFGNAKGIYLKFEKDIHILRKYDIKKAPNILVVLLKDTIIGEQMRSMKDQSYWTKETNTFYGGKIVKEIKTMYVSNPNPDNKPKRQRGH